MEIIDLTPKHPEHVQQAAEMLYEEFRENWPDAWPTLGLAQREVRQCMGRGKIRRIAVEGDRVLGWVGAQSTYSGRVWELHPLVVASATRGQGIGRTLVADLEQQVAERGGITLWVGTDDEANLTTLGGADLYPNPLEHLAQIRNLGRHPYEFYQKLGFSLVGVLPDANGPGKPDIFLAKRVMGS